MWSVEENGGGAFSRRLTDRRCGVLLGSWSLVEGVKKRMAGVYVHLKRNSTMKKNKATKYKYLRISRQQMEYHYAKIVTYDQKIMT